MPKTILSAADRIEKKFGSSWSKAGESMLRIPNSISTGSLQMDEAIGDCKGYPEGSVIEVYGPQHSGKTLMGYLAIASSQKKNPYRENLIIDAENQFRYQSRWAQSLGVNVPDLYVKPITSGEEAFDLIEMAILGDVQMNSDGQVVKVIKPGNFGVILVDSVTQLVPLEMIHKGMDESQRMAAVAALMSKGLKKILSAMVLANSKTIIYFINQLRMNPNAKFGANPESRTGGTALPFYDTISFRVSKIKRSEERNELGKIFAHRARIKFDKNKAGSLPADPIEIRIRYDGTGIDQDEELFSVAEKNELIVKFKRKYNFVKPGTEEILDESIENFSKEQFGNIIKENSKIKDMILNFIREGKFYSDSVVEEDVGDESEDSPKIIGKEEVENKTKRRRKK